MFASLKRTQNPYKSDNANQTEQLQNLLASLIFMDNAAFIRFDSNASFTSSPTGNHLIEQSTDSPTADAYNLPLFNEPLKLPIEELAVTSSDQALLTKLPPPASSHLYSFEQDSNTSDPRAANAEVFQTSFDLTQSIDPMSKDSSTIDITASQDSPIHVADYSWSETHAGTSYEQSYGFLFSEASVNPQVVTPVAEDWSSASGWGQINVGKSLEWALPDYSFVNANDASNTPAYLTDMGFTYAWANGFTGKGVVIAAIDTGFDFHNPYLTQGIDFSVYNWNFIDHNNNVQDDNGHGTMTASEMVADPSTGFGICGGSFDAELMVLKALDASGKGSVANVCEAIYYAVDHGADIINMSLGQNIANSQLQSAMQYAWAHDVVVVAAAGNNAGSSPSFPAAYGSTFSNVIAVGASDYQGAALELANFSNHAGSFQPYNYVTANGVDIIGFGTENTLWSWSGTSMSAPLVASQAAILESANPALTAAQIIQAITGSADNLDTWLNAYATGSDPGIQASGSHDTSTEFNLLNTHTNVIQNAFPLEHMY